MPAVITSPATQAFRDAPRAFSLLPFWFWNDQLDADELLRQIGDFESHGVHGFVLHPRVGLPRDCGWMSDNLLGYMRLAIDEAARRGMTVLLYDEGMYPSGSASGQVVAENPAFACRCIAPADPDATLPPNHHEVWTGTFGGQAMRLVDRPADSVIRGLHYVDEGPDEDEPPAADLLNPDAVAAFIRLVYDRYAAEFGDHFGRTIRGIFTDEPHALGRCRERDVRPGTTGIFEHVERILGEDFRPYLPALWRDDFPDASAHRRRYAEAIGRRLEETWYQPLHAWCGSHGVWLCGHPADGDDIASQRFFQAPGQDLVWRWVEPDQPSALTGPESTQAKASSSAKLHLGRARNSNEFGGAYGPETTFEEIRWLAHWCLVRGVDMLIPHAFYYSIRGPRRDERPPQLGPHAPWWDRFGPFAEACRCLCGLNARAHHVCDVAILTGDRCPWQAAATLYQNQIDFNYLEARLLTDGLATADDQAITIGAMRYRVLVVEDAALLTPDVQDALRPFERSGRVCRVGATTGLPEEVQRFSHLSPLFLERAPSLRIRRLTFEGQAFLMLFNETRQAIEHLRWVDTPAQVRRLDPASGEPSDVGLSSLRLNGHEFLLLHLPDSPWSIHESTQPPLRKAPR